METLIIITCVAILFYLVVSFYVKLKMVKKMTDIFDRLEQELLKDLTVGENGEIYFKQKPVLRLVTSKLKDDTDGEK